MRRFVSIIVILLFLIAFFSTPQNSTITTAEEKNNRWLGFYNGLNNEYPVFSIGSTTSVDKINWGRSTNPLLTARENLFDSHGLNGPFPVKVGDLIYLYYAGYNGKKWSGIGLAILTKDLHIVSRPRQPVLSLGESGSWDDSKIFRPVIIYDPNSIDPQKRFIMYYTGADSTGVNKGGIAFSEDGLKWIKSKSNPVLDNGKSGDFDSLWAMPENIKKVDGIYYMLYNGYNGDRIQTGLATSDSIEGPWEKSAHNPILKSRASAKQNLINDAPANSTIIQVSDSSVFEVDEACFLSSSTGTENVRIKTILDSNRVELYEPTVFDHTTTNKAVLNSILSHAVGPNQLEYDGVKWMVYGSAWGVIRGYETTTYAEGESLTSLKWIHKKMPTLNYDTVIEKDWDSKSQENLKFIQIE